MEIRQFQEWVEQFYTERGWIEYGPFIRVGFLMEEVGEVARVVRALEIGRDRPDEGERTAAELKQELNEELGDVLANLIVLAKKYDIELSDIVDAHIAKLTKRFE